LFLRFQTYTPLSALFSLGPKKNHFPPTFPSYTFFSLPLGQGLLLFTIEVFPDRNLPPLSPTLHLPPYSFVLVFTYFFSRFFSFPGAPSLFPSLCEVFASLDLLFFVSYYYVVFSILLS